MGFFGRRGAVPDRTGVDRPHLADPARILTGFVVAGVVLSAIGLYQPLVDLAGAGATVPLSGFGHLMAQGVRDAVDKEGAIGILTGALSSAAAGIGAAVVLSLLAGLDEQAEGEVTVINTTSNKNPFIIYCAIFSYSFVEILDRRQACLRVSRRAIRNISLISD